MNYIINYIFEAFYVGLYSVTLYVLLAKILILFNKTNISIYFLLFFVGFIKHSFGYLLNIHTLYCNYVCNKKVGKVFISSYSDYLWLESIIEGILYLFIGAILMRFISNKMLLFFMIGVVLHIIFEMLGLHKLFCNIRCIRIVE